MPDLGDFIKEVVDAIPHPEPTFTPVYTPHIDLSSPSWSTGLLSALNSILGFPNDKTTRITAQLLVQAFLQNLVDTGTLAQYRVICDDTNNSPEDIDNHIMNIDVYYRTPTSIARDGNFTITIS